MLTLTCPVLERPGPNDLSTATGLARPAKRKTCRCTPSLARISSRQPPKELQREAETPWEVWIQRRGRELAHAVAMLRDMLPAHGAGGGRPPPPPPPTQPSCRRRSNNSQQLQLHHMHSKPRPTWYTMIHKGSQPPPCWPGSAADFVALAGASAAVPAAARAAGWGRRVFSAAHAPAVRRGAARLPVEER